MKQAAVLDQKDLNVRLRQSGYKLTRQRRAVVEVVTASRARLSAAEAYSRAQRLCPDVGLTTVYRTLDILLQLGVLRRVHLDSGCEAFAPSSAKHGHSLICEGCRATVEFEDCDLSRLLKRVARQTGFRIEQHWLELVGRCPQCQRSWRGKARSKP